MKISFATPTYDKITKDEKANLEAKLSTVGRTMGLLTGFSIISSVEILYFAARSRVFQWCCIFVSNVILWFFNCVLKKFEGKFNCSSRVFQEGCSTIVLGVYQRYS